MAAAISPGTGRVYGVACVCEGFGVARSSFYLLVAGFQADRIGLQGPGIADFGAIV